MMTQLHRSDQKAFRSEQEGYTSFTEHSEQTHHTDIETVQLLTKLFSTKQREG